MDEFRLLVINQMLSGERTDFADAAIGRQLNARNEARFVAGEKQCRERDIPHICIDSVAERRHLAALRRVSNEVIRKPKVVIE
jgi:hypothetical protein